MSLDQDHSSSREGIFGWSKRAFKVPFLSVSLVSPYWLLFSPWLHGGSPSLPDLMPCCSFASQLGKLILAPKYFSPRELEMLPTQQEGFLLLRAFQAV